MSAGSCRPKPDLLPASAMMRALICTDDGSGTSSNIYRLASPNNKLQPLHLRSSNIAGKEGFCGVHHPPHQSCIDCFPAASLLHQFGNSMQGALFVS
jgi:hypothetical protein